jgi:dTDP-L-rhamnose 4-epimerase
LRDRSPSSTTPEGRQPMRGRELVLITGGAGFIGSHVADALLARGYGVRLLDNLDAQVHGSTRHFPGYLASDVEALNGDVRDAADMTRALEGVSAVYHFAAAVGVGQSMYQIERYTDVNNRGTAVLLEALLKHPVRKLIVASSMSVYGEGQYRADDHEVAPLPRSLEQLKRGDWEVRDADGRPLEPVPTREDKTIAPQSIYALSKLDQETMCLLFGRTYGVPTVALRFFNVYGPRQALANPYTGVLANFAARYLNGNAPMIFEDGLQKRDFVHVRDLAQACVLALETPAADVALNIGSGNAYTILEIAQRLARVLGREDIAPEISGRYRAGDIRNCYADISRATRVLGYRPGIALDDGLAELGEWLADSESEDHGATAVSELQARGLVA